MSAAARPLGPRKRWGRADGQLTLGAALAASVADMDAPGMHVLSGAVRAVQGAPGAPDSAWRRGTLDVDGCAQPVPFVGAALSSLRVGCEVELAGYWPVRADPEHGPQLRVEQVRRCTPPRHEAGLVRYLVANVNHVGEALARRLVTRFGADVLDALELDPARVLDVVGGATGAKVRDAVAAWADAVADDRWARHDAPRLMQAAGVTYALALRIVRHFRTSEVAELVARRDPFRLLDVPGIGWQTADRVAAAMGVAEDAEERADAAVRHALDSALAEAGHSGLPRARLVDAAAALLARSGGGVAAEDAVERALTDGELVASAGLLCRPRSLAAEWAVADVLGALAIRSYELHAADEERVSAVCVDAQLSLEQATAVRNAITRGLSVLTGGPGVGKTHALRAVVVASRALGLHVRVAAPTGKAAIRAAELTGERATTLHKLLGGPVGGDRENGPLGGGVLVVDESSMCDLEVAAWLARNLDTAADVRVVLVGDADQLPSVGPGQVLADVIASGVVPVTRLTEVRRQRAGSRIVANAHAILRGAPLDHSPCEDWVFVEAPSVRPGEDPSAHLARVQRKAVAAVRRLVELERGSLLRAAGVQAPLVPVRDVQVLAPTHGGPLGVSALNEALRPVLNPRAGDSGPRISERHAAVGDRVICTRNAYDIGPDGLMNGEQGVVEEADARRESISVRLDDGRVVRTEGVQNYLLSHAFCTTVHKAQGSEYPYVVVVYHSAHGRLLDPRVLYTALTRARERVILVADRAALDRTRAVSIDGRRRDTTLAYHLRAAAGGALLEATA